MSEVVKCSSSHVARFADRQALDDVGQNHAVGREIGLHLHGGGVEQNRHHVRGGQVLVQPFQRGILCAELFRNLHIGEVEEQSNQALEIGRASCRERV